MVSGEKYDFISGWHATTVRVMNHNNCHYRNALFSVIPADMSSWQIIGFDAHHTHFNILWARQNWAISQTTFWNTFSWMKIYEFRWRFHWHLFLRFELTIFPHWFRLWLGALQATSHYLNRRWLVYWLIPHLGAISRVLGHGVKCPILTTVVPGFFGDLMAVPFGANGANLGICTLPEKNLLCVWNKLSLGEIKFSQRRTHPVKSLWWQIIPMQELTNEWKNIYNII